MISFKKNFYTSLFFAILFYLPIYLIDKPFTDDYARSIRGYFGWSGDGRPLADLFIYIVNFGSTLTDTSPLSSILAVLICALTCAIISYNIVGSSSFVTIAAASSLIVSPFFFHNALYHYDFFTMSFSMLFCVIPFVIFKDGKILEYLSIFICLVVCLCLYQASYPLFFSCLALMFIVRKQKNINYFYACASAGFALIAYQLFIGPAFITGDYVVNHSSPVPVSYEGLLSAIANLKGLFLYLSKLTSPIWIVIYSPAFVLAFVYLAIQFKTSKVTLNSVFYFLCISFGVIFSCIMFFLTKDPAYYPRVMIGFNSLVMLILCTASLLKWKGSIASTISVMVALTFNMSIITNLINYTKSMYRFESQTAQEMRSDMAEISLESPLFIHGYPPYTQIAKRIDARYPFAKDIIHPDLGWSTTRMFAEIEVPFFKAEKGSYKGPSSEVCGSVAKEWNGIYTILKNGTSYHAVFRNETCK
ncbi:glucosyltransferase domain-containing protein [Yersinia kristensenii]|uniref:glucosyltransferase domain-containing protein n=1 Tax=Yersinia kristensenii TaxID=28152 RepID=UPI0005DBF9CE|nr:glucosyltransferase domain-containing protein [Yersinia kristensenii]CNE41992.1 Uncharacterised protein [Yersinia kristensenii]